MAKSKLPDRLIQDRAREHVIGNYNKSSNFQNPYLEKYKNWYGLYRNFQSEKSYHGRADLFVPEAFSHIEAVHARTLRAFQGVRTLPQSSDDVDKAKSAAMLLDYQTRVFNYKQSFKDLDKTAKIYGHGILKASWVFTKDGKRDHPLLKNIDPVDYFWDPDAVSREFTRYEIHKMFKSIDALQQDPNLDQEKVEEIKRSGADSSPATDMSESVKDSRRSIQGLNNPPRKGMVEVLEYWGLFSEEEDGEPEEYLITVANRNQILRLEKNPFVDLFKGGVVDEKLVRPFVLLKDTDVPSEFHGMGMVEPIEKLQQELNDTRNQRMDNVVDIIDHAWYILDGADIDESELVRKPGQVIHGAIPNGITPLPVGDVTQSSYNEETIIKQDIQRALGIPDVATGSLQGSQGETATTVLALQESANVRFDVKIAAFADAVRHAYSIILAYNQRWMDKEVMIRLEGRDVEGADEFQFETITKEDIAGKFDIDIQMDTQMNKIVRRQEAFTLYQLLAQTPLVNQEVNVRTLLEALERKDVEQLLEVPPPVPQPPEEPKKSISVNLKGDLNALESDDIAVIMGASQESADPLLRPELRELLDPEGGVGVSSEDRLKKMELEEKAAEETRLNRSLDLKSRELDLKEKEFGLKTVQEAKK